jgi:hypothetical protein
VRRQAGELELDVPFGRDEEKRAFDHVRAHPWTAEALLHSAPRAQQAHGIATCFLRGRAEAVEKERGS